MEKGKLYHKCVSYLKTLCEEIPERGVGSEGNRQATSFFQKELFSLGWQTEMSELDVIDWEDVGATLQVADESLNVFVSPYSLGCSVHAPLISASCLEELERQEITGNILYAHGGFAILIYTAFYLAIFGRDEVKWMFINSGLGLLGIYSQIDWLLSFFGKKVGEYPIYIHVVPFLYFVLYTFLIRQAILDLAKAREDDIRKKRVENGYVAMSVAIYAISYFLERL